MSIIIKIVVFLLDFVNTAYINTLRNSQILTTLLKIISIYDTL